MIKELDFVRLVYLGTVDFLEKESQHFELRDKGIGEYTLDRHENNSVSVWFMRSDGGCCGRYEIKSDARTTARKWIEAVINTIGYPRSKELRDAFEAEINSSPEDFCLTMSD